MSVQLMLVRDAEVKLLGEHANLEDARTYVLERDVLDEWPEGWDVVAVTSVPPAAYLFTGDDFEKYNDTGDPNG